MKFSDKFSDNIYEELSKNLTKILKDNERLVENIKEIMNKLTTDVEISKKDFPVFSNFYEKIHIYMNRMSLKPK